jgi:hypothetical protein
LCKHYNCLGNHVKGVNEISCYRCDADYDGCTGLDKHGGGARAGLNRYYKPEPKAATTENTTVQPVVQPQKTQLEIYKELIQTKEIGIKIG